MRIYILVLLLFIISCSNVQECSSDSDCVPAACCHSSSCTSRDNAPICQGILCSLECAPDTLDCGQGSCSCNQGKCDAVFK